ncbi:unnamed protein product [Notodromas monacha]|uniref:Protein argonaute N-terminal domain-containing protein n=1 Tax=Notodromas monacha TaxID=399045 RepID=A0A7R9BDB3_9CRUS|nr:unnamed protein product [Notodromas monacha]CAG0913281.1 unnamed protein product [Notodromas monacha]
MEQQRGGRGGGKRGKGRGRGNQGQQSGPQGQPQQHQNPQQQQHRPPGPPQPQQQHRPPGPPQYQQPHGPPQQQRPGPPPGASGPRGPPPGFPGQQQMPFVAPPAAAGQQGLGGNKGPGGVDHRGPAQGVGAPTPGSGGRKHVVPEDGCGSVVQAPQPVVASPEGPKLDASPPNDARKRGRGGGGRGRGQDQPPVLPGQQELFPSLGQQPGIQRQDPPREYPGLPQPAPAQNVPAPAQAAPVQNAPTPAQAAPDTTPKSGGGDSDALALQMQALSVYSNKAVASRQKSDFEKIIENRPFLQRPQQPGDRGRKIQLFVNQFVVSLKNPKLKLHMYDVTIEPKLEEGKKPKSEPARMPKWLTRELWKLFLLQHERALGNIAAFDGSKICYAVQPGLRSVGTFEVQYREEGKDRVFLITLKSAGGLLDISDVQKYSQGKLSEMPTDCMQCNQNT